jgi:ADP-ribose pyrophosphatase
MAKKASGNNSPEVEVVSSTLSYEGPLFRVYTDKIIENGRELTRDVIRHNGSVVVLEVPAGKMEEGEDALAAAKRELLEETGFKAKRWRKMIRYFASPGFLGEFMQVFLAEGLTLGDAQPEYDEQIEIEMMPLSILLKMIDQGKIYDGKTLISVMLYARLREAEKKKNRK